MCTPTLEPSREGFTTTGKGKGSDSIPASAPSAPLKARYAGVGMPWATKTCLAKTFSMPTDEASTPEPV